MNLKQCFMISTAAIATALTGCSADTQGPAQQSAQTGQSGWTIDPGGDLNNFFDCLDDAELALVSAHRGGPASGLPENSIEAMMDVMGAAPAMMEVDVAASSDGVLFLMHDDNLDRTTTGRGLAEDQDWSTISSLRLEDNDGRKTAFSPPRFSDALAWAKTKTILQVDFKRSARYEDVVDEIYRQEAEDRVILIAYSMASAQKLHRLAPDMMISLSVDSQTDLNRAVAAGIPTNRLMGFTGTEAPRPRLFSLLDDRDVESIFGTLGGRSSIDREIAQSGDEERYAQIAEAGADILATDRPREAFAALTAAGRAPDTGQCGIRKTE